MAIYCISLDDEVVSLVEGADAYCLEGPLTTFFRTRNGSAVIDSWSERLASFRTASIARVQRLGDESGPDLAAAPMPLAPAAAMPAQPVFTG